MIVALELLAIIALAIYIAKAMVPVYLYIKDRLALRKEHKKIKAQSRLAKQRMDILLEKGWTRGVKGFFKSVNFIRDEEIKGWSDIKFNNYLEGKKE